MSGMGGRELVRVVECVFVYGFGSFGCCWVVL